MRVRLTHLDGKLPNLALMKLSAWYRARRAEVVFTRNATRAMDEGGYDHVYGSQIFERSAPIAERLLTEFPEAIIGGSGTGDRETFNPITVEEHLGVAEFEHYDYSLYPTRNILTKDGMVTVPELRSFGFSMRGCRLNCGFCKVRRKEGLPTAGGAIGDIWRGDPYPRHVVLYDNDFFAPSLPWQERLDEIRAGGFKVSFNQGINVRLINDEAAQAIASVPYYNDDFTERQLYTAYDNFKDEGVFRKGMGHLLGAGIPAARVMVYMLIGFDKSETWERIFERLNVMLEIGVKPFPMVFELSYRKTRNEGVIPYVHAKLFQKWITKRYYLLISWGDFLAREGRSSRDLHDASKALDAEGPVISKHRLRRHGKLSERAAKEPGLFGEVRRT